MREDCPAHAQSHECVEFKLAPCKHCEFLWSVPLLYTLVFHNGIWRSREPFPALKRSLKAWGPTSTIHRACPLTYVTGHRCGPALTPWTKCFIFVLNVLNSQMYTYHMINFGSGATLPRLTASYRLLGASHGSSLPVREFPTKFVQFRTTSGSSIPVR